MNKELLALEKIKKMLNDVQYASKVPSVDNEIAEIEKALKELEIIRKEKQWID